MTTENDTIAQMNAATDEDLYKIIGAHAISNAPSNMLIAFAAPDAQSLLDAGKQFFMNPQIKAVICNVNQASQVTVEALISVITAALGIAAAAVVPMFVVAIAVLVMKAGLQQYCAN